MEKQKRWQFYLILAVLILTIYNILPTVFYYSNALKSPVDQVRAEKIADNIVKRVNGLEADAVSWLWSFSKLLDVHPLQIALRNDNSGLVDLTFTNVQEADRFRKFLPEAGSLVTFAPGQLELYQGTSDHPEVVTVARKIQVHLNQEELSKLFQFSFKHDAEGKITPFYRQLVEDRVAQLALAFGGPGKASTDLNTIILHPDTFSSEAMLSLAKEIVDIDNIVGKTNPEMAMRYYRWFLQSKGGVDSAGGSDSANLATKFIAQLNKAKTQIEKEQAALQSEQQKNKDEGVTIEPGKQRLLHLLSGQLATLNAALGIVQKNTDAFKGTTAPLTIGQIYAEFKKADPQGLRQVVNLQGRNPFIQSLVIDWSTDQVSLGFYPDVLQLRNSNEQTEEAVYRKERLNQFVINEIAYSSRIADETFVPNEDGFVLSLNNLLDTQSFIAFNLGYLAEKQTTLLLSQLNSIWQPKAVDLSKDHYPVMDFALFQKLKPEEKKLGLLIYAPSTSDAPPLPGFRSGSIYVIARGMENIMQKAKENPNSEASKQFVADVNELSKLLQQNGFIGYAGSSFGIDPQFSKDYIFELSDYYGNLLKATRESFSVKGSKKHAVLDFSDVEQRLLTLNKIDDLVQEDLLKWKEEYSTAQVDIYSANRYKVPAPTQNAYWENFKLSFIKYFRGDDRKILKWGLDLSGGKTVRIGLRDHNNRVVTNPDDLNQAVNELYNRINSMGVSERNIHIENHNIILEFPGSQGLTAAELVKASAMYFHIVNEKFSSAASHLNESANRFLQNVWNEAVVTNRKDVESINEIAWQHLGGESLDGQQTRPRSEEATVLWENGLRLANPKDTTISASFNDTLSKIAVQRGSDFMEWENQTHPLVIVFAHYALEGSSLNNIQAGYDSTEGNVLSFGVRRSYTGIDRSSDSPRDDLYAWTSQFAEDRIAGTSKETVTKGKGWRMAVILNDSIVSMPTLHAALRDGGRISGRFSQREINQLAADLKAGSLTFTPKILSEQNVSPELGKEERAKGIIASLVAVSLVVIAMVAYYRFAGLVASCAVLLNILIMWGVLQNLGAALTLPTIAGIVLTIGMAVDANVLVFERIREEFAVSGRIASAIQAGYRKAFTAIIDSNITTIIAALILVQFDSGPIKGFAVSLIVGILSSMFTALFMTRYFFAGWVQNPENKRLEMSQFIGATSFDFMAQTKKAVTISLVVMIAGIFLFISQRHTMLGMDFTGGYSLVVELQNKETDLSYRELAANALQAAGAISNDFQVRELSRPNQIRLQFGVSMEEPGHPFHHLPEEVKEGGFAYPYQSNPRLVWVVDSLQKGGLNIQKSQLELLDRDWTVMSGQFSEAMRDNAIIALTIALVSILLYITIRFEFAYALGAVVGLVHDIVITLGIMALFHKLGFAIQIDLQVVGAIMTIIGYSLNDTIIVFDRIREDCKLHRKMKFTNLINHSLNITLSRTLMTSGTTLLVLLALVFLGGKSIFSFSLVMTVGVLVGTISSLFIASPVMLYFHNREENKKNIPYSKQQVSE